MEILVLGPNKNWEISLLWQETRARATAAADIAKRKNFFIRQSALVVVSEFPGAAGAGILTGGYTSRSSGGKKIVFERHSAYPHCGGLIGSFKEHIEKLFRFLHFSLQIYKESEGLARADNKSYQQFPPGYAPWNLYSFSISFVSCVNSCSSRSEATRSALESTLSDHFWRRATASAAEHL